MAGCQNLTAKLLISYRADTEWHNGSRLRGPQNLTSNCTLLSGFTFGSNLYYRYQTGDSREAATKNSKAKYLFKEPSVSQGPSDSFVSVYLKTTKYTFLRSHRSKFQAPRGNWRFMTNCHRYVVDSEPTAGNLA